MNVKMKYENVYKYYRSSKILNKLDLEIYDGEFLVVLGPSGTGKTTLLRVTVGIEDLTAGKILMDGVDISKLPPNKRNIAMVFQNYALYPNMTAYQNIAFPLKMARKSRTEIKKKVSEISETLASRLLRGSSSRNIFWVPDEGSCQCHTLFLASAQECDILFQYLGYFKGLGYLTHFLLYLGS